LKKRHLSDEELPQKGLYLWEVFNHKTLFGEAIIGWHFSATFFAGS
jgi:hypothetical protein